MYKWYKERFMVKSRLFHEEYKEEIDTRRNVFCGSEMGERRLNRLHSPPLGVAKLHND